MLQHGWLFNAMVDLARRDEDGVVGTRTLWSTRCWYWHRRNSGN